MMNILLFKSLNLNHYKIIKAKNVNIRTVYSYTYIFYVREGIFIYKNKSILLVILIY